MALKWTEKQRGIYKLISEGRTEKEIIQAGYKRRTTRDVEKAVAKGDTPGTPVPPGAPKFAKPGEPLFEASTKGERVILEPIILMRYDSVRNALGWGKEEYPLNQFVDEATDIATELVGAVPPGFIKEEEPKDAVAVKEV